MKSAKEIKKKINEGCYDLTNEVKECVLIRPAVSKEVLCL